MTNVYLIFCIHLKGQAVSQFTISSERCQVQKFLTHWVPPCVFFRILASAISCVANFCDLCSKNKSRFSLALIISGYSHRENFLSKRSPKKLKDERFIIPYATPNLPKINSEIECPLNVVYLLVSPVFDDIWMWPLWCFESDHIQMPIGSKQTSLTSVGVLAQRRENKQVGKPG